MGAGTALHAAVAAPDRVEALVLAAPDRVEHALAFETLDPRQGRAIRPEGAAAGGDQTRPLLQGARLTTWGLESWRLSQSLTACTTNRLLA